MALHAPIVTVEQFDEMIRRAEYGDQILEFIGGEIVEVPSNPYASQIAMRIGRFFGNFVEKHDLGHVTGEGGLYVVAQERYAPDVAFISKERQPELARQGANPNPPDLAVEVVSDESSAKEARQLSVKISNYLAAGVEVWVFYPVDKAVAVHIPGQGARVYGIDDVLMTDKLPGFKLPVKDVFPK